MKKCSMCKKNKPIEQFHRNRCMVDGYHNNCKKCRTSQFKKWNESQRRKREETFATRHPERQPKPCKECNQIFTPRRRGGTMQVFCSKKCYGKDSNRKRIARYPERVKIWWDNHPGYNSERDKIEKEKTLNAYGGCICSCCGETKLPFLTIDHINGGGNKHRREIGTDLYRWLRINNFPPGFRVLCMNCNFATRYGKSCPHEKERREKNESNKTIR